MSRERTLAPISENAPSAPAPQKYEDEELDSSPLWHKENEGWELTWPIWHMLPRDERKAIAKKHGYKSIGEFEEYMSLQQAVDDSGPREVYNNALIYPAPPKLEPSLSRITEILANSESANEEDDDDDSSTDEEKEYNRQSSSGEHQDLSELIKLGGKILILHDELLHTIFSFLPVDTYGTLVLVSPHWKHLTRTESVYKRLCERLYLNQSKRRQLHVSRFGGLYQQMLEQRPRVKASGGCYVLKYSHIKKIQRDMWTEVPVGAILETVYYRYLYFQEDGRVLYALTTTAPHEMFRRLLKVCLKKTKDPAAVWGTFQVQKDLLTIVARQNWHTVKFEMLIKSDEMNGRFGTLVLTSHCSSISACFEDWSNDLVEYKVPDGSFRFVKNKRL
jgi:F-box protein 9